MAYRCAWCRSWNSECRVVDGVDKRCEGRRASAERLAATRFCPVCGESRPDHNYVCDGGFTNCEGSTTSEDASRTFGGTTEAVPGAALTASRDLTDINPTKEGTSAMDDLTCREGSE